MVRPLGGKSLVLRDDQTDHDGERRVLILCSCSLYAMYVCMAQSFNDRSKPFDCPNRGEACLFAPGPDSSISQFRVRF